MANKPKYYSGAEAVKQVEQKLGRPLNYIERRVVEEEGFVDGVYKDDKGYVTAGVGQTGKYMNKSFDETMKSHIKEAERLIPSLKTLPEAVQAELIQATYRGDVGESPTFRKLLNAGEYEKAAQEFLNNDDYRTSVALNLSGKPHGVAGRMEKVAQAVANLGATGQNPNTIAPADVNSRADTRLERQGYVAPAEPSYFESLKNSLLEGWNSLGNYFNAPEESQQSQLARQQAAQQQQQAVTNQNQAVQDMNARVAAIFGTAAAGNTNPTASSQPLGNFIQQGMLGPLSGTAYGNVQTLQQAQQAQAGMLAKEQAAEAARKAEEARQAAAIAQAEQAARAQAIISGNRSYTNPITGQVSYTPSMGPVSSSSSSGSFGGGGSSGGGMGGGTGGARESYGGSISGISGGYSGVV